MWMMLPLNCPTGFQSVALNCVPGDIPLESFPLGFSQFCPDEWSRENNPGGVNSSSVIPYI